MTPEELSDWLDARPDETRVQETAWIASRSAARVLPVLLRHHGDEEKVDKTGLQSCRCILVSGVSGLYPTPEIRLATAALDAFNAIVAAFAFINNTHAAARAVTSTAAFAARAAAFAARAAAFAALEDVARATANFSRAANQAAIAADTALLEEGNQRTTPPLWPVPVPGEIADMWDTAKIRLAQDETADWGFWVDWYDALLAGRPQDPNMLTEIALIDDDAWAKGPAHVNAMIAGIVRDRAGTQSYLGEQIERDREGLFSVIPVLDIHGEILTNAVAKVADRTAALRAVTTPENNALIAVLPVLDDLDETVARHADTPLRLHDDFREAHVEIDGMLRSRELAPDRRIDRLQRALASGALDCEGNSQACGEAVKTRVNARALNLSEQDQSRLQAMSAAAQAESDAALRRDLAEDLETGLDRDQPEDARANAMKREGSRLMRIKDKRDEGVKTLNDTARTIKSADTVWDFVSNIWQWFI